MTPSPGSSKMFHTFQGLAPPQTASEQSQETPRPAHSGVSKRITTPHACAECKRRKIRCDGRQPCGQCLGCRSPKPCYYDKHRQRVIPSRKTLDALSQSLEECRSILKRLYPTRDAQSLLSLTRQDLIALLDRPGPQGLPSQMSPTGTGSNTSPLSQEFQSPIASNSDDDRSLANLEQIPSLDMEWDEERRNRDPIPAEADDVNALSLSMDRQSSYLGASSIKAAFLVMLKVAPILRSFLAPPQNGTGNGITNGTSNGNKQGNVAGNYPTPRTESSVKSLSLPTISWSSDGQTLIDAYFNRVQIFVPMLDEPSFRADYLNGRRQDAPWLALLNMVFAMGSIVANKSDDHTHINYYNRAKEHLGIDSFGSAHLETLQALALMGGYYLHYINRPNMANAVTGAALRMACAMGLHRESMPEQSGNALVREQRRRTWWSVFCLDTWASTTLGRPSMGRWGPGITICSPEESLDPKIMGQNAGIIPLIENIKFCKISTQIQDVLAQSPLLRTEDRTVLDGQLVAWHDSLPWILKSAEPCAESIHTARSVMKWRYQNIRIVLYRPVLLNLANRGNEGQPSQEELAAVAKCRAIAKQSIEDIAGEWTQNQMLGWNGVWFLYQASMIPLVSMFWESWNTQLVRDCQVQIEIVLEALEGMSDWSLAARRSREVLVKMYEASKRPPTRQTSPRIGPVVVKGEIGIKGLTPPSMNGANGMTQTMNGHGMNGQVMDGLEVQHIDMIGEDGMVMVDHQAVWDLDGMLWGNLPDGLDIPFDRMLMDFDDASMGYGGNYLMQQ
ncbi:Regulatory protein GAL4 [Lachnellula hyalina]|uniref:Regulatory protein GAL4 n=1 Tax=Lachnellula hyalina TaxID=1316788 RepID=A0A8H8R0A9_9HELO|nr:Regulatory protein GAL4 [Lachnellula hyalina]TVY24559.1 Regulatory protein GAL4 [Lachnellula hyalina]